MPLDGCRTSHTVEKQEAVRSLCCPACRSTAVTEVFRKSSMPKYNLSRHLDRKSALQAPRGDLDFRFCQQCYFTFNAAFDQASMDYAVDYEASRASSQVFTSYLNSVCDDVQRTFDMAGKRVVEIGCGDGQFLLGLRRKRSFSGYGFDQSAWTESIPHPFEDIRFVQGGYTADTLPHPPDLIMLRHILEHQANPHEFLNRILPKGPGNVDCYIEVPAWEWIVEHFQIAAFHYEHCSYYTRHAMQDALAQPGIMTERITYGFNDEYLQYYGRSGIDRLHRKRPQPQRTLIRKTEAFRRTAPKIIEGLAHTLRRDYPDAVFWGAAGKGTTLLNLLELGHDALGYVVDSNPRRVDTFIPGTGQHVVNPEFLKTLKPRQVLLTNPLYTEEIRLRLHTLGLKPRLIPLDDIINAVVKTLEPHRITSSES